MKRYEIVSAVALLLFAGIASAENARAVAGGNSDLQRKPNQRPQPRYWCEQVVGSGLWECYEYICSDWLYSQSGCYIVHFQKDGAEDF